MAISNLENKSHFFLSKNINNSVNLKILSNFILFSGWSLSIHLLCLPGLLKRAELTH